MVRAPIKRAVMTENKKFTHDMILGSSANATFVSCAG